MNKFLSVLALTSGLSFTSDFFPENWLRNTESIFFKSHDDDFTKCLDSGDAKIGSMFAIIQCEKMEYARVDKELNRVYKLAIDKTHGTVRRKLKHSERSWILARDRKCKADNPPSMDDVSDQFMCFILKTEIRTTDIVVDYKIK